MSADVAGAAGGERAGQFPVAGVTAADQQHPPGGIADRDESARGHPAGGGGVWLMVIFAADARSPGPRPAPAAGQGDRARGPVRRGRGTSAWSTQTPHRISGVLIRMIAEPLRVRRAQGSHGTPFQQTKGGMRAGSARAIPLVAVLSPRPSLPGGTDVNQAGARPDRHTDPGPLYRAPTEFRGYGQDKYPSPAAGQARR